jgi:hypothetical protein
MPLISEPNMPEAEALILEALGHLRKGDGREVFFEDHEAFVSVASSLLRIVNISKELTANERARLTTSTLTTMCRQMSNSLSAFLELVQTRQREILS